MGEPSDEPSIERSQATNRALDPAVANRPDSTAGSQADTPSLHPDRNGIRNAPTRSATTDAINGRPSSLDDDGAAYDVAPIAPPAAVPHENTQAESEKPSALDPGGSASADAASSHSIKQPMRKRMRNGSKRFWAHTKDAIFSSWINLLLVFVPVGIASNFAHLNADIIFAMNAIAIIPLAGLLARATESVAIRLGDTMGALLNISFGNAVELIIFIVALVKNEIPIVQASLLGSILVNLLLVLGTSFLVGGLRFQEQIYNNTVTQMSACLLSLSVMSLLLPTAFHASFSDSANADKQTLKISRGTSVVLLFVYVLYLLFQLKSHAYLYESTPQERIDEESHPGLLADIMDSSTSSSSSSDSDDTDTTSGSHTTAKRFRRAFRRAGRRKSNASSEKGNFAPPLHSPTNETHSSYNDNANGDYRRRESPTHQLHSIVSGDEADGEADTEQTKAGRPRIRDFETVRNGESSKSSEQAGSPDRKFMRKKKKYKKAKRERKAAIELEKRGINDPGKVAATGLAKPPPSEETSTHVAFAEEVEEMPPIEPVTTTKRPLFHSKPTLPRMLTQNVFVAPPEFHRSENRPPAVRNSNSLRRTNSAPDRLNANRVVRKPLPPYAMRVPPPTVREIAEDEEVDEAPHMSRTSAVVMLIVSTTLVAICAEFLVDAIPAMTAQSSVSTTFIGLIILPIVGNTAEQVTAVTVAAKNKMDLAIGVAVGSSIQVALFVTPLVVILGWILGKDMTLYFTIFETVSLFVTAFVVNFLVLDGKSNYLEGTLLCAAYTLIGVCAFFYPNTDGQSVLGGSPARNATNNAF